MIRQKTVRIMHCLTNEKGLIDEKAAKCVGGGKPLLLIEEYSEGLVNYFI